MAAQTGANKGTTKKIGSFFKSVKAEVKKVSWPNKKELINYTLVVLAACGLVAFVVWLFDLGVHKLLSFIV